LYYKRIARRSRNASTRVESAFQNISVAVEGLKEFG
jgi:hypothetical protein